MSIWASTGLDGPDLLALKGDDEAANYRAEGTPTVYIDVATTGFHDHVRLSAWSNDGKVDMALLLSPDAVALLQKRLEEATRRWSSPA